MGFRLDALDICRVSLVSPTLEKAEVVYRRPQQVARQ